MYHTSVGRGDGGAVSARRRKKTRSPGTTFYSADLPSDLEIKPVIVDEIMAALRKRGLVNEADPRPELVIDEAVSNAIRHGNRQNAAATVHVELARTKRGWGMLVADEGDGFDPSEVPDPTTPEGLMRESGRGILLMKKFMDVVEFRSGGTVLWCEKVVGKLPAAAKPKGAAGRKDRSGAKGRKRPRGGSGRRGAPR